MRLRRPIALKVGVAALLLVHWLLAVSSVREKSTTFDEIAHLSAGVSLLRTGDYRFVPEHPPLLHVWAAVPVVIAGAAFPDLDQPCWWSSNQWELGRRFFYKCGNDPQDLLLLGRASIAILSVALGVVVWLWSRRLFGQAGGMLSLVLYVSSPTMLAHGRLVTTDLGAALFFLLAVAALWWMLHRISLLSVLAGALAVTGLLLSKMSGLLILPIAGVLVLVRLASSRPTTLVVRTPRQVESRLKQAGLWLLAGLAQALVIFVLVWGAYGFRYAAMRDAQPGRDRFFTPMPLPSGVDPWDYELEGLGRSGAFLSWARARRLLPEAYLFGLAFTLHHAQARPAFLNGQTRFQGWWYFFPYCFAVKTPLALFGLLLMAAAAVGRRARPPKDTTGTPDSLSRSLLNGIYRTTPLWALVLVYGCFAIRSHMNIGHRHLLPIYPVLFIFAGHASVWLCSRHRMMRWLVPGLAALFVISSLLTFPNYLAYFNVPAGGPKNAYKRLVDSSLDWGQDLPGLKDWLDHHASHRREPGVEVAAPPVYLSYFGTGLPKFYGIDARMLPGFLSWEPTWTSSLSGGVYCISATMLHQLRLLPECRWTPALEAGYQDLRRRLVQAARRLRARPTTGPRSPDLTEADVKLFHKLRFARLCARLRQRAPDDDVGHSILIYRLSDGDVRRALDAEPAELVPDQVDNLRRLGNQCFQDGCFASAAIFYEHLFKRQPMTADTEIVEAAAKMAMALMTLDRDGQAIARLREGLRHDPGHAKMNNNLAWLLATSRSASLRDGREALCRAKAAMDATGGREPTVLDTLAAAYAELGQFEQARQYAGTALGIAKENGLTQLADHIAAHLARYASGRPWREP